MAAACTYPGRICNPSPTLNSNYERSSADGVSASVPSSCHQRCLPQDGPHPQHASTAMQAHAMRPATSVMESTIATSTKDSTPTATTTYCTSNAKESVNTQAQALHTTINPKKLTRIISTTQSMTIAALKHFPSGTPTVFVFKIDKLSRPDRPTARAPDRPRPPDRPLDRPLARPPDRPPDRPTDRSTARPPDRPSAGLSKQTPQDFRSKD